MEQPPVQLRILGYTELVGSDGRTGSFVLRQPKRLALLAYLALASAGGYRRRDQIVALFWPELDQAHARTQLRKVLHALRATVGPDAFGTRGEEEIRLHPERVWCDAVAFTRHVEAGQWSDALALYRGDLLEGLFPGGVGQEFESWLENQRATLREEAARAAWECSSRADLAGRRTEALALARRAVELDPQDEEGVRRLIAALDRHGDRAGALRVFREWQSQLRSEFDAEPAPETRKLARKVAADRKGESVETPAPPPAVSRHAAPAAPTSELPSDSLAPSPTTSALAQRPRRSSILIGGAILLLGFVAGGLSYGPLGRGAASDVGDVAASFAALPFRGLGDSTDARIGEGVAEELTTALTDVSGIVVRSTSRSRQAIRNGGDIREISRRLKVGHIIDGTVRHHGTRLRVTVRLIRATDGVTVWTRAFDADYVDFIAAQEEVAKATVRELRPRLDSLARRRG